MGSVVDVTGAFTLEGWVRPSIHQSDARVVDYGQGKDNVLLMSSQLASGKPSLVVNSAGLAVLSITAPDALPLNTWSHVAGVINADRTAALYVNGRLVASGTASQLPNMTAAVASLSGLIGGSRLGGLSINGGMADVRIWTVGRTQAEIQASMPVGSVTGPVTGLVAAYPFGATGEGAYNDVSGNGRTLTASGDVRFQVLGPSSPSAAATDADVTADLKGSAYYTLGTIPAGRTFTIEAWVNPRNYIDFGRIVDLGNAGYPNDNILLVFADGGDTRPGLMVTYGTDGSSYATKAPYPIPLNAWSHIAGTIDSAGVLRIFVNGRLEASATAPPRAANIVARSNSRIGANTAISQVFNGSIADVRIWNYPRSEAQIRATMPVGSVSGPAVGLIRAYPLGSTGADVLSDVALSGNPLTQVGSPEYRKTGSGFLVAQGFQGSASLVTSAGQLTLLGNNTYTGATTIGGGAVLVGNGGTSGTLGTGNVANSGILTFNRSDNLRVAGAISGSGPLFKQGAGALTLSGTNSFTGGLTVQGGTVAVAGGMANNATNVITVNSGATFLMGNNSLLGGHDATPLTPFVVQSGGVLQAGDGLFNVVGPITLRGGTLRATSGRADANGWSFAFRGTVTVDGGAVTSVLEGPGLALGATSVASGTFDVADGSAADDLVVSGGLMNGPASTFPNMQASSLVKTGVGRMTLTGSNAYTGTTTVSAGTLQVGNGGTSGTLGAGNVVNNAALAFNRSDAFTVANAISGTGTLAQQGSGTLVLSGANSYSGASTISSGALQVGAGGATGSLGSGNVVNNGALILNRNDAFTVPNVVSGPGTLTVQGGGIATLTGANTYAGTSTISAGTLQVGNGGTTGALGSGSVVNNGTLAFNRSDNITVANVVSGTGGLLKQGNGTVTLSSANTFTGATEITAGTLALGASGTLGTSSRIALSGGAALDVTARSAGLVLPSGRTLANTGGSATLRGNIDASAPTLSLSFDGTNPSFSVVNGTLTLAANTQVQVSKTGSAMSAGLYRIISKGSGGAVSGVAPAAVTVTGAGTGGLATSLFVVNGELLLQVGTPVTINLGNLAQTYNATPRPVSITTTPAGISTAVTYNGGTTVPTAAGTYAVSATITAPGYYGSASGSLVISKAPAMVRLGNLFQNYDGTARRALAITDPSGLSVNFTYGGNANAPTNQGVYNVVATINDTNYSGVTNGILRVRAATPGSLAAPTSQPPAYVNHQGFLSDASGTPLGSPNPRNYDLIFRIYSGPSGGSSLWTEYQNVTLDQGRYSVMLGDGQNVGIEPWPRIDGVLASGSGSSRYLQVTVRGLGVGGSDVTLMPRFLLASQPYAFLARHAATADTLVDSNGVPVIRVSGNSVGINVEQPNAMLDVGGVLAADSVATSANATISGTLTAGSFVGRGTFPLGTIVAWTGGDAPNGWALCDGRTVNGRRTPDLRGRFVVGQGQGPGLSSRLSGQTGGEESVTLSTLNMGQHNHVFDPGPATSSGGGSHSHNYDTHAGLGFGIVNSNPANPWGNSNRTRSMWVNRSMSHDEGPHDHAFSVSAWSSGAGLGQAHPNMPPFHVLAYIMRVQ